MTAAILAQGLTKRYGRRVALSDCTVRIPADHVVGLVGPNGAGKTTLLQLAVGLLRPTWGEVEVLGRPPACDVAQLARVGFVAQDAPVLPSLTVAEHLRLGEALNPGWDVDLAVERIGELDLDPGQRAGHLSGGQRAQLALTVAMAKRPELLVLDEPVASLDPLARRKFLQTLMRGVAEEPISVVMSSHLVTDLERVCDYLVVLAGSQVQVAGEVDELLNTHHRLTGRRRESDRWPVAWDVITEQHTPRQSMLVVRTDEPILDPQWTREPIGVEDLVLAYMERGDQPGPATDSPTGPRRLT